jgi:hypothetical protein
VLQVEDQHQEVIAVEFGISNIFDFSKSGITWRFGVLFFEKEPQHAPRREHHLSCERFSTVMPAANLSGPCIK